MLADVVAELLAVAVVEVPSGLATVAPCETVAAAVAVEDDAGGSPSGFETVAPCDAGAVVAAAMLLAVDGVAGPGGLAAVVAGVVAAGALTVADRTLAVMLGEPAELGVELTGAIDAGDAAGVAVFATTVAATAGFLEPTVGSSAAAGPVVIFGPAFGAGATFTLMVAGALVTGALEVGTVFIANSGLGGALGAAAA